MPGTGASTVDLDFVLHSALGNHVAHHAFGQRRTADVTKADKENLDGYLRTVDSLGGEIHEVDIWLKKRMRKR